MYFISIFFLHSCSSFIIKRLKNNLVGFFLNSVLYKFAYIELQRNVLVTPSKLGHVSLPTKELSFCHKLKFPNPYIYGTWCCRLLIFQTKIIWCNRIHSLKYLRSTTLDFRDIGVRKSEFVTKTQFLSKDIVQEEFFNLQ